MFNPFAFNIDFIRKLCRSDSELKGFKQKLKLSLEEVRKAHLAVNRKSKWDYEISASNYLMVYPKGKTKKQLGVVRQNPRNFRNNYLV